MKNPLILLIFILLVAVDVMMTLFIAQAEAVPCGHEFPSCNVRKIA